jgi:hypothetical protein
MKSSSTHQAQQTNLKTQRIQSVVITGLIVLGFMAPMPKAMAANTAESNITTRVLLMPITSSDATMAADTMDALQDALQNEIVDLTTSVSQGTWPASSAPKAKTSGATAKSNTSTATVVESHIKQGKRSLKRRRYKSAQRSFEAAISALHRDASVLSDVTPLVRAHRLLALSQFRRGKKQAARNQLAAVVAIAGEQPQAGSFPKKFMALEADVRAKNAKQTLGSLHVEQGEKVETVYLDGKVMGRTPLIIENVTPGHHVLRLERYEGKRSAVVKVASAKRTQASFQVAKEEAKSVTERIQQNRFDATVRKAALKQARKSGADIVVVASLERSIVGMVYTAFMGRVSSGTWTRLRTVRADMDLLNAKVGLGDLATELKAEQQNAGTNMGRDLHTFRPVHAMASASPSISRRARTVFFARNP